MQEINVFGLRMVKERSVNYELPEGTVITSPARISELLDEVFELASLPEEAFVLICLDTKHKVIGTFKVSTGSLNASIVHPREVYKRAVVCNSHAIVVAHNHPSGNPTPSQEDIGVTQRLKEAGDILGIHLLDHVIVGRGEYLSFKQEGLL